MKDKSREKLLMRGIKQIKKVVDAFQYKYFFPLEVNPSEEALESFDNFRNDTLFKLVDQWKKMELELMEIRGLLCLNTL